MDASANTIASKVSDNDRVMDQLRNNTKEQGMLGAFPESTNDAVIQSMGVQKIWL
jgi:type I restriction enzyme R subunit